MIINFKKNYGDFVAQTKMYLEKFNIQNEVLWRVLNIKNYYIHKDLSIKLRMTFHLRSIAKTVDELFTSDDVIKTCINEIVSSVPANLLTAQDLILINVLIQIVILVVMVVMDQQQIIGHNQMMLIIVGQIILHPIVLVILQIQVIVVGIIIIIVQMVVYLEVI